MVALDDRWSLRLEVSEDEIERLYAQGLTRGALVWRSGLDGWRPLLTTPELSSRLLHTRITLSDAALEDEVTLPRPARLPSEVAHAAHVDEKREVPTVAPTALDALDTAPPSAPRRRGELALVAALAFGLAWVGRGSPEAPPSTAAGAAAPVQAVAPPAPAAPPLCMPDPIASIPIVALADLPLLGASTVSSRDGTVTRTTRPVAPRRSSSEGPTRQELVAALSRVASVASGCGERDGAVRVVITFANSGVARSIQVSGSGLPTPVRSCIIGAASRARVASFGGAPVTISKSL